MGEESRTRVLGLPAVLSEVTQALRDNLNGGLDPKSKETVSESDLGCVAADLCISDFLYDTHTPAKSAQRVIAFAKVRQSRIFSILIFIHVKITY
jgi:hypothetical protein